MQYFFKKLLKKFLHLIDRLFIGSYFKEKNMTRNERIAIKLIEKAIELKRAGVYQSKENQPSRPRWQKVIVLTVLALAMSACAGIGFKMEGYRIDELQASQKTYPKPLKCLFTSCPEWDAQRAGEGS